MYQRTNEQWLSDLRNSSPAKDRALTDLHATILGGLPYALSGWLPRDDPDFDSLAEEVPQETLIESPGASGLVPGTQPVYNLGDYDRSAYRID